MNDIPVIVFTLLFVFIGFCTGVGTGLCISEKRWLKLLKDSNLKLTEGQKPKDKIEPLEEVK